MPAHEQAERQGPWRALVMILNAKLEAVEAGITTITGFQEQDMLMNKGPEKQVGKDDVAVGAPTAEESKAIDERIASDPDDFELDDAWFEGAKPTQELFPEAYARAVRQKEALKAGLIQRVNITLDRETIAWFKAQMGEDGETGGTRWLELVAQTLREQPLGKRARPGACTPQNGPVSATEGWADKEKAPDSESLGPSL